MRVVFKFIFIMEKHDNQFMNNEWNQKRFQLEKKLKETDIGGELKKLGCILPSDPFEKQHNGEIDRGERETPFSFNNEDFILIGRVMDWPGQRDPLELLWKIERKGNCKIDDDVVKGSSIAKVFQKINQLPPLNQDRPRKKRIIEGA